MVISTVSFEPVIYSQKCYQFVFLFISALWSNRLALDCIMLPTVDQNQEFIRANSKGFGNGNWTLFSFKK